MCKVRFKGITFYFVVQRDDSLNYFLIGLLPVKMIFPGIVREDQIHSISSLTLPLPVSN